MTLVRYDSPRDIAALQQGLSRVLEGFYTRPQEDLNRGAWAPLVDIYSDDQHDLVLKAELPDMKEEEIELTVEDNTLTLSGERKLDAAVPEQQSRSRWVSQRSEAGSPIPPRCRRTSALTVAAARSAEVR